MTSALFKYQIDKHIIDIYIFPRASLFRTCRHNECNVKYEETEGDGEGGGKGVGGETTPGGLALEREKVSC